MAHKTPTLPAEKRDRLGTRYARRLRDAGRLPAVVYGHQTDPVAIHLDHGDMVDKLEHGAHLFNIDIAGAGTETCLVKDLQFGWLGDNVIHVDLLRVDLNEEVTVNVALEFKGDPESAKKPGAVLTHDLTDLEVICTADSIPSEIMVHLGDMEDTFTVGEIELPPGVRTEIDPETPVAHIAFVEELEEPEEVEVIGEEEPEVISEDRQEEDAGEESAAEEEPET